MVVVTHRWVLREAAHKVIFMDQGDCEDGSLSKSLTIPLMILETVLNMID